MFTSCRWMTTRSGRSMARALKIRIFNLCMYLWCLLASHLRRLSLNPQLFFTYSMTGGHDFLVRPIHDTSRAAHYREDFDPRSTFISVATMIVSAFIRESTSASLWPFMKIKLCAVVASRLHVCVLSIVEICSSCRPLRAMFAHAQKNVHGFMFPPVHIVNTVVHKSAHRCVCLHQALPIQITFLLRHFVGDKFEPLFPSILLLPFQAIKYIGATLF